MTTVQKRDTLLLVQRTIGPLVPVWGVVETTDGYACECISHAWINAKFCGAKKRGKHPRFHNKKIRNTATSCPEKLRQWLKKYPCTSYGVLVGDKYLLIDCDVKDGVDGIGNLAALAAAHNEVLPPTVTVITGSGGRHYFYQKPEGFTMKARTGFLPNVDMKNVNQYAIAAGSTHISGGTYQFAPGLSPDEVEFAPLPDYIRTELLQDPIKKDRAKRTSSFSRIPDEKKKQIMATPLPPAGTLRSDKQIINAIRFNRKNRKAQLLLTNVTDPLRNTSEDDMYFAALLAFYTSHNWDQAMRLFRQFRWRKKFDRPMPNDKNMTYAAYTMHYAFLINPGNWIPSPRKPRKKKPGPKKRMGRPASLQTACIILYYLDNPQLTPSQIAVNLSVGAANVRRVLRLHDSGRYLGRIPIPVEDVTLV